MNITKKINTQQPYFSDQGRLKEYIWTLQQEEKVFNVQYL